MTDQSAMILFIIGRDLIPPHICKYFFNDWMGYFCLNRTISICYNGMGSSCIKSSDKIPFFIISYRKLCLIAVMPRFFHPIYRLHLLFYIFFFKTAYTGKTAFHKPFLKVELFIIRNLL